jgi:hypothetical protein
MKTKSEQLAKSREEIKEYQPSFIKSEVNLTILPLFALSRQGRAQKEAKYKIRRGEQEALLRITTNSKYGFPTALDYKVFKAVEYIITQNRLPIENPVKFSIYQICKLLGVKDANVKHIKDSLRRIKATLIETNAFFLKDKKKYTEKAFSVYDEVIFKNELLPDGDIADSCHLWLNQNYLNSLNVFYVKPLDFKYFITLDSDIARRLYDILTIKFYGLKDKSDFIKIEYNNLCQLLPITPQKELWIAKKNLQPAHEELISTKFLANVSWNETGSKWMLFYYPGQRAEMENKAIKKYYKLPIELPLIEPIDNANSKELKVNSSEPNDKYKFIQPLIQRGFNNAESFLKKTSRTSEEIELIIKDFDRRKQEIEKPAAWFNTMLTQEYYSRPVDLFTDSDLEQKQKENKKFEIKKQIKELEDKLKTIGKILSDSENNQITHFAYIECIRQGFSTAYSDVNKIPITDYLKENNPEILDIVKRKLPTYILEYKEQGREVENKIFELQKRLESF